MVAGRSFFDIFQNDIKNKPASNLNNVNIINKNISYSNIKQINELIDQLRKQDFDYVYKNPEGKNVLIKYHDKNANENENSLNPISPNEEEIQSLFFLRGMLLIAKNDSRLTINDITNIFDKNKNRSALFLANEFIKKLSDKLKISAKDANVQLTMAKDICILMTKHPAICTISEEKNKITIEKSTPYQISEEYYNNNVFKNLENQDWYHNAKKFAGFKEKQTGTWLDNFFINKNNRETIQKLGVSAPPSARWWPTPANNQVVEIDVAKIVNNKVDSIVHTEFLRTGVAVAYDIRKIDDKDPVQKALALEILKELIRNQLTTKIEKFKELYGPVIGTYPKDPYPDFYINYQTLLSPIIGEMNLPHVDNNAKFINIVKEAINEVRKTLYEENINLIIEHTNSAVNRNAHLSNEFSEDDAARHKKIAITRKILLPKVSEKALYAEITHRRNVCEKLEALLYNESPYDKLGRYQRNIMMAALEHLVMGSQCINLAGCKSARDRTGIFAAAVKVMLEDPKAMDNWEILEKGIAKSLKQGHAFRSMIFHNAVLKVSMVHEKFMKMLNVSIQEEIKSLLIYARKLPKYNAANHPIDTHSIDMEKLNKDRPVDKNATMTIAKNDAEGLLKQILKDPTIKLNSQKNEWEEKYKNFSNNLRDKKNHKNLDNYLMEIRNTQLNSTSYIVNINIGEGENEKNLNVRVFPKREKNIDASIDDMFASGIDSMRGALLILEDKIEDKKLEELKEVFKIFHKNISTLRTKNITEDDEKFRNLQAAHKEYTKLNGTLTKLLVDTSCYTDKILASKGMLEARDLLWIQSRRNEAVCTVKEGALSFSKRCEFTPVDDNYKNKTWFKEFSRKHTWAEKFFDNNKVVLQLSPTPMQRSIPNPANAWEEATILIKDNKVGQIISGIRLGITSSYQIHDKNERQRITNENHARMITDDKLIAYANKHIDTWGENLVSIKNNNELIIPIFHQTLVDPGALRFIADRSGNNPNDMIKRKKMANQLLQNYLDKKEDLYYDPETQKIVTGNPENKFIKIKFQMKETNNGVNTSEKVTTKTEKDVADAQSLIVMTTNKLQIFRDRFNKEDLRSDIDAVINYLNNSQPNNPRKMTIEEEKALQNLCNKLCSEDSDQHQKNLSLLTQAAVNLASFMSNDLTTNIIGSIKDGAAMAHARFKPVDINDATYKSCYERIMAELLGVRMGGCKSALDREQEVAELTNAMYRQFDQTNTITNYYDTDDKKEKFLKEYVNTRHKHNMGKMATSSDGTIDLETQGQAFHHESPFEQKVSALFSKLRHPGYYDDHYLRKVSSTKQMFEVFLPSKNPFKSSVIIAKREENPQNNEKNQVIINYRRENKILGRANLSKGTNIEMSVDSNENKSWLTSDLSKLHKMSESKQRIAAMHWILESSKGSMPTDQAIHLTAYRKLPEPFLKALDFYLKKSHCELKFIYRENGKDFEDTKFKSTLPSLSTEEIKSLQDIYDQYQNPSEANKQPEKQKYELPTISLSNKPT